MLSGLAACALTLCAGVAAARDRGADGQFSKRSSSHFVLFQDVDIDRASGWRGSDRFERDVLAVLESAYDQLDSALGLRPPRAIRVLVYDPSIFDAQFAGLFRFAAAGFYGGDIRIRGDTRVTVQLARVLYMQGKTKDSLATLERARGMAPGNEQLEQLYRKVRGDVRD